MNARLMSPMPLVKEWLESATSKLSDIKIASASLDAELILAFVLKKDRSYLRAHDDRLLNTDDTNNANTLLEKRLKNMPIAYLLGYKEYYGRQFIVNNNVLIPRPESEDIIEILKQIIPSTTYHLLPTTLIDIGTGSGCLGITAKLEFPNLDVTLSDISKEALDVAASNARNLSADVLLLESDLLTEFQNRSNIIIANLPYVDKSWKRSPETDHEPGLALFADNGGMELIEKLLIQASKLQNNDDSIIIEADPEQHGPLIKFAKQFGYQKTNLVGYIICFKKV